MMTRILTAVLAGAAVFFLVAGIIWYLAFGAGPKWADTARMEGLDAISTINWSNDSSVEIRSSTQADALSALGYAHGRVRTWQTLLWRQAALGRLSEWFGPDAVQIDQMIIQLGIAASSRQAVGSLSDADKHLLERYSRGLNVALQDNGVALTDPLVLLEIDIEPWQPFHSLAIERLLSWTAVELPNGSQLFLADSLLRNLTHIFGFSENTAISSEDFVAGRFITGDSGEPFFLETDLAFSGVQCRLLTAPGTLVFPLGSCGKHAWNRLMKGTARIHELDGEREIHVSHERIHVKEAEYIVRIARSSGGMPFASKRIASTQQSDGTGRSDALLQWSGLDPGSDIPTWTGFLREEMDSLRLFRNDGFDVRSGTVTIRGEPQTVTTMSGGVFISNAPVERSPADRVRDLSNGNSVLTPELILTDLYSPFAASTVPRLLSLISDSLIVPSRTEEALTYLRNWNFRFDTNEIGASLFDVLLSQSDNDLQIDSGAQVLEELSRSIELLEQMHGVDMRNWRWETVQDRVVHFPGWTHGESDSGRPEAVFLNRFAPVHQPGAGHAQTLTWGGRIADGHRRATSAWEGAFGTRPQTGSGMWFRRSQVGYDQMLGRSLAARRPVELISRRDLETAGTTRLVPKE